MENNKQKKFYQKKWFWIVLGVVLIIAIANSDSSENTTTNPTNTSPNTTTQVEQPKEAIKVTATILAGDYESNEIAADQKYKGKFVEITGTLKSIEAMLGSQFITIEGNQILSDIQCFFDKSKESELATLIKGKSITVRGKVDGKSLNVGVRECEIVK